MSFETAKTKNKKALQIKIDQAKQVNQNLEAALNCLAATLHRGFPIMTAEKVKEGTGYIPLFKIHGKGDVAIKGLGYVLVKEKLTLKDKVRNVLNGFTTQGFERVAKKRVLSVRGLLARFRRPSKADK